MNMQVVPNEQKATAGFSLQCFLAWNAFSPMGTKSLTCSCSPLALSINSSFSEACKIIHFSLQDCKNKNRFCSVDAVLDFYFHHILNQTTQNIFHQFFCNFKDSLFHLALCIVRINTIQQAFKHSLSYFRFLRFFICCLAFKNKLLRRNRKKSL